MNCKVRFSFLLFLIFITAASAQNTFFIKYKSSVSKTEINQKVDNNSFLPGGVDFQLSANVQSVDYLADGLGNEDEVIGRIVKVTLDKEVIESRISLLQNLDPGVEYIQKANVYQMDAIPNDTLVNEQWALAKIKAFDAWDKTEGSDSIIIGMIDTGIDYFHPEFEDKICLNEGEMGTDINGDDKKSNGIDDDNNGFIDDWRGWDFTDRVGFPFDSAGGDYLDWDNDPIDENGHGTFISGIAGARTNNVTGIAGAAPNIKLMNLRAFDPSGFGEEDDVAAAIIYAVQMGVQVLNMSFGDNAFSLVLRDVVRYAYSRNVVLVGSAGNSGSSDPHYPSGYSEVISVGNSTIDDVVASNSNFGSTIDLVAPGTFVLTTRRDNEYAVISGTSASTPHVAATAALILSIQNFTNEEVKQILKTTTDDIGEPGWDLRSGAGRLNMFRAVTVVAPSAIKFNHPLQDFATFDSTLVINATVLSPLFSSYDLYSGTGLNPEVWEDTLIENGTNQFSNEEIYTLGLSSKPDSVYALRLVVQLTNGRTLEERVNFFISRTPPTAELISIGPAFYGDRTTILAAMFTDEPSVTRMFYRQVGVQDFRFVTLDGFTINNQFVKYFHYGFIPRQLVEQNSVYEVYFEAENLVGLTTTIKDGTENFFFTTIFDAELSAETQLTYSLPAGSIFHDPVNITSQDLNEIYIREFTSARNSHLYKLIDDEFVFVDSLSERIIRDFGDFNNNGLKDLLTFFTRNGYLSEQVAANSSTFNQKFSDESGQFWPILAEDVDGDNITEVMVVNSDTSVNIWEVNNDLRLSGPVSLYNFTESSFGNNILDSPNGVRADIDGNGTDELWFVDIEGDIFSYNILGSDNYQQGSVITTGFIGSAAFVAAGDYNGDNVDDLAVLLHSIDAIDIAPFYRLVVFNLIGGNINTLYDQALIDAATEFSSSFQQAENSIRFADIDNDSLDELILFMFPYAYIFEDQFSSDKIIAYKENINSNSIFIGDLNNNGVLEVAFPTEQSINFYEFAGSNRASTPYNLEGYSLASNEVKLSWDGGIDQYFIHRGTTMDNLQKIDSVLASNEYDDFTVEEDVFYYYAVQAFDPTKEEPLSSLSRILEVYSHTPGEVDTVFGSSKNTITVSFTEKMSNTIENLQAFELLGVGFPNSIAPATQFSYLLTFSENIPAGTNQLIVKDLRDFYRSPIQAAIDTFHMDTSMVMQEFFISSFDIIDPYQIRIVFNLDVDEASVTNTNNYSFEPDNAASSVSVHESDGRIITVNLKGHKPVGSVGREYVLRLENITSSASTGSIPINSGAGSYLVLSGFADDLSDVYVYPNPANVKEGNGTLTFANLPQRAKITIWNISGTQINELEEADGNGGVTYNLRDYSGDLLATGIYVFRIVMLDEDDNEKEEKLGKFAVVR